VRVNSSLRKHLLALTRWASCDPGAPRMAVRNQGDLAPSIGLHSDAIPSMNSCILGPPVDANQLSNLTFGYKPLKKR
jgi:hypothetical protein